MDGEAPNEVADLLLLARADPVETLRMAREVLESDSSGPGERAIALRAMSIAAREAETYEDSVRYGRQSAQEAEAAGDPELRSAALGTLAGSLSVAGDTGSALDVLSEATHGATGLLEAQLTFQRGRILDDRGHSGEALEAYEEALPLFREVGNEEFEAMTLRSRGNISVDRGDLESAEADLLASRAINIRLGLTSVIAGLDLNLGKLFRYKGDLPEALKRLTAGDEGLMAIRGDDTPQHAGRVEALITAGLYAEALTLASAIAKRNRALGDTQHASLAYLVAARAAVLAGQPSAATELAGAAAEPYEGHADEPWLLQVRLISSLAKYELEGPSTDVADTARDLAPLLEIGSSFVAAADARLLAGRVLLELGDGDGAEQVLVKVASVRRGPVETRLQAWLAKSLLRRHKADSRGTVAAARAGLELLDDYQAALGSSDMRAGIERWGSELGAIGLEVALGSGRPRRVLEWMERTRARSLVAPAVLPSQDPLEQAALLELRRVEAALRKADDEATGDLQRRRRSLQEKIKNHHRIIGGTERERSTMKSASLAERLGDRELIEFGVSAGQLWAVHVKGGRFGLHDLGTHEDLMNELRHLRLGMRRTARTGRGSERVKEALDRVDRRLLGPLKMDSDSVVVVPTPGLMAVPWAVLPRLAGTRLVIAPSAETWMRSEAIDDGGKRSVVVGGPDLEQAATEVDLVGSVYRDATLLPPETSEVEVVLGAMADADVAHIACHAAFQVENPMFSSLRLADGDLNVYDIEKLGSSPSLVVLSACDSGYTETRPGEELMGITSALLRMGSKSIVASVGLVPDSEATAALMVDFHRGISRGMTAASALRSAQQDAARTSAGFIAAASFVCVGGE